MNKKPGMQPGTKRPGFKKVTEKERDDRIDEILDVISNQPTVSQYKIRKRFTKKWKVHWSTVDRYLHRARNELRKNLKRGKEEVRSNAVAFYEAIINNPLEATETRLKAQKLLTLLLGANAPERLEVSGPEGSPIQTQTETTGDVRVLLNGLTVDQLKTYISRLEKEDNTGEHEYSNDQRTT